MENQTKQVNRLYLCIVHDKSIKTLFLLTLFFCFPLTKSYKEMQNKTKRSIRFSSSAVYTCIYISLLQLIIIIIIIIIIIKMSISSHEGNLVVIHYLTVPDYRYGPDGLKSSIFVNKISLSRYNNFSPLLVFFFLLSLLFSDA